MFVAIIMESYEIVREQEEKVTLMSYLRDKLSHVIGTTVHPIQVDHRGSEEASARVPETLRTKSSADFMCQEEATLEEDDGRVQKDVLKLQTDVELVLASLVDFRKEMRSLGKKVHQITETGGKGHYPSNFLE